MADTSRSPDDFAAVLFDLDGVITSTASVHAAAWKELFDGYLEMRDGPDFTPFDLEADYLPYVDGKPRYEGVKSFLDSRGIHLPFGSPDDPPDVETCCGLGNKKNRYFKKQLEKSGAKVFASTVEWIHALRAKGVKTAVVSSSKNCEAILDKAGIADLFDLRLDGVVAEAEGIPGKPKPDTFIEAARRLGVAPGDAVVVEDAISGVMAGQAGGFGLVIGIDRADNADALAEHGADVVVGDIEEILAGEDTPGGETTMTRHIADLPSALDHQQELRKQLLGKRLAVFLDYDGTLTPIVERPDLAVLDEAMRRIVRNLADRCTVCIVSGRDRPDVEELVGIDNLVYAGSHGFDIASPDGRAIEKEIGAEFAPLLEDVIERLHADLDAIEGTLVEPKRSSVAAHYRLVAEDDQPRVKAVVDAVLAEHPDALKVTPGKMVWEIQPKIDWDKGRAVLYLLEALDLGGDDVVPFYFGDDHTDEHAFAALAGRGIGVFVGDAADPEVGNRATAAAYRCKDQDEAGRFLDSLAR